MRVDSRHTAAQRLGARACLFLLALVAMASVTPSALAVTYDDLVDPILGFTYRDIVDERGARPAPRASFASIDFHGVDRSFPSDAVACSACPKGLTVVDRFAFDVIAPVGRRLPVVDASVGMEMQLLSFDANEGHAAVWLEGALQVSVLETSEGAIDPVSLRRSLHFSNFAHRAVSGIEVAFDIVVGDASIDLVKLLAAHGVSGDARVVSVSLEVYRRVRHVGFGQAWVDWMESGGGPSFLFAQGMCLSCPVEPEKPPPVPEPSAALMIALGLAGLARRRPSDPGAHDG